MIRIKESDHWILVEHREHARLAGEFGRHWRNQDFTPPEPRDDILVAVARHDDAWAVRDAHPCLTRSGLPSAFSHELVGTYSAFEEIDLAEYLGVRGRATEVVATDNPYAAVIISMHTVNLLTEQADLRGLSAADLALHHEFVDRQRRRQQELIALVGSDGQRHPDVSRDRLQRAFEFLQVCDSLSLITCVRFPRPIALRHKHPRNDGAYVQLQCIPLGPETFRVTPYPFDADSLGCRVPCRRVPGYQFSNQDEFRAAYAAAPVEYVNLRIVR